MFCFLLSCPPAFPTTQAKRLFGKRGDPFYEAQENHNLIGVANVFLECLFCDVKLQYAVPIISQQGEVKTIQPQEKTMIQVLGFFSFYVTFLRLNEKLEKNRIYVFFPF